MTQGHDQHDEPHEHHFGNELGQGSAVHERLLIRDIVPMKLNITADLGQCSMLVRDIIELKKGSVVPLNKLAGEMADIYVNGVPLARGEVMVMGDTLQVRIAEIFGATEKDLMTYD